MFQDGNLLSGQLSRWRHLQFDVRVVDGQQQQAGGFGAVGSEWSATAAGGDTLERFKVQLAIFRSICGGMAFDAVLLKERSHAAFEKFGSVSSDGVDVGG
ncbi:MAG UNVERIFIED_CONTAM: hypothetical protein LVR18_48075 [Planctomycetaceae bacterium]